MQDKPVRLIGVYNADGGIIGELKYVFGHLIGTAECELCDITHSPVRRKPQFDAMAKALKAEYGVDFLLRHLNERTPEQKQASEGRAPCVLAEYPDGKIGMLLDKNDLKAAGGDVAKFEKILRGKLLIFF